MSQGPELVQVPELIHRPGVGMFVSPEDIFPIVTTLGGGGGGVYSQVSKRGRGFQKFSRI